MLVPAPASAEDIPDAAEEILTKLSEALENYSTSNNTTVDAIVSHVRAELGSLPDAEEVVCYAFSVERVTVLVDYKPFSLSDRTMSVKVSGYALDTAQPGLQGPGYHVFNVDLNNALLCPIFRLPLGGSVQHALAVDAPVAAAR